MRAGSPGSKKPLAPQAERRAPFADHDDIVKDHGQRRRFLAQALSEQAQGRRRQMKRCKRLLHSNEGNGLQGKRPPEDRRGIRQIVDGLIRQKTVAIVEIEEPEPVRNGIRHHLGQIGAQLLPVSQPRAATRLRKRQSLGDDGRKHEYAHRAVVQPQRAQLARGRTEHRQETAETMHEALGEGFGIPPRNRVKEQHFQQFVIGEARCAITEEPCAHSRPMALRPRETGPPHSGPLHSGPSRRCPFCGSIPQGGWWRHRTASPAILPGASGWSVSVPGFPLGRK